MEINKSYNGTPLDPIISRIIDTKIERQEQQMNEFLKFFDEKTKNFPMHLEIFYSKICDWCITVYKKGCAKDYPESFHNGDDAIIVQVSGHDMELCFAKAHVELKEWLLENEGGY